MPWHEFVFSAKPKVRFLRHTVFWVAWWLYFAACQYVFQQPRPAPLKSYYVEVGEYLFLKTFLLLFISVIACYAFNYFILPQGLKGKRLKPIAGMLTLCALLFGMGYVMYWTVFPFMDSLFGTHKPDTIAARFWPAFSLGLIDPLKVVAAAAIIKYVKYWWLKQQESKRLEQEKIDAELQLLKAQIHPSFLFNSLNNIYVYSLAASPRAPEMLLKLSDLLSYMLYECGEPLVPLNREIEMMHDYIALEKIRLNNDIEVEMNTKGDTEGTTIAPFLLLPFIENSFKQCNYLTEHAWLNLDISVENYTFTMKLANGIVPGSNSVQAFSENGLRNVQKRLFLIYPQRHELKITQERELLFVLLKIQLAENTVSLPAGNEENFISDSVKLQPNFYAHK